MLRLGQRKSKMKVELIGLDRDPQNSRADINIGWVFGSSSNKIKHDFSWAHFGRIHFGSVVSRIWQLLLLMSFRIYGSPGSIMLPLMMQYWEIKSWGFRGKKKSCHLNLSTEIWIDLFSALIAVLRVKELYLYNC